MRKEVDKRIIVEARDIYAERFASTFTYRVGGERKLLASARKIAAKYREL